MIPPDDIKTFLNDRKDEVTQMKKQSSAPRLLFRILSLAITACLLFLCVPALADYELAYEGTIVVQDSVPVAAPYGGRVSEVLVRKGDLVQEDDTVARIATTPVYAPLEGTVSGIYAEEGDSAASITERYGAVLYIEPLHKYKITATTEKAYNSSETKYIHLGEEIYLSCTTDGSHYGTGIVTTLTDTGYTVEVTGGEFYMGEKVGIYRKSDYDKESCIGRGTVGRTSPVAVKEAGSILKIHVKNGDFVERGQLLYETVSGDLDGLYAPQGSITAPFTGIVASVDTTAGANVNKNDTLLKLYPASAMQASFNLPESDLTSLAVGDPVTVEFDWTNEDITVTTGKIASISHMGEADGEGSSKIIYKTYVDFVPIGDIRLGMNVTVYPSHRTEEEASVSDAEDVSAGAETEGGHGHE